MTYSAETSRTRLWTAVVLAVAAPFVAVLVATLWRSPFPLSEGVAIFEDVAKRPASGFLTTGTSYYRPLFYLTLSAIWHHTDSLENALVLIRLLHIIPLTALVLLLIGHLRPRTAMDAAAASVAVASLIGSQALLGNLELPLSYTIVGMPAALIVWMLLERSYRVWHGPVIVLLTLVAVGFKEQGLVIVPLVIAAWRMGAPGVGRGEAAAVSAIGVAYVVFRLAQGGAWPVFAQDVGLGFERLSISDAEARFGAFPFWVYAYNSASTIANVLFAEPTEGVFRIAAAARDGRVEPWHLLYVGSSFVLTGLIAWWGLRAVRDAGATWSSEARLFVGLIVALLACGALSYNYSRERLAGMAVVFYALAAFFAVRVAAVRAAQASRLICGIAGVLLLFVAGAWQIRAVYTVEFARRQAINNVREWMTDVAARRIDFAGRPTYLRIMHDMTAQGTGARVLDRPRYPRWFVRLLGEY